MRVLENSQPDYKRMTCPLHTKGVTQWLAARRRD